MRGDVLPNSEAGAVIAARVAAGTAYAVWSSSGAMPNAMPATRPDVSTSGPPESPGPMREPTMTISRLEYGEDESQFGELYLPAGTRHTGTVVIIHGGFWGAKYDLSLGRPLAIDLVLRDYVVWNLEYRRIGNGGQRQCR